MGRTLMYSPTHVIPKAKTYKIREIWDGIFELDDDDVSLNNSMSLEFRKTMLIGMWETKDILCAFPSGKFFCLDLKAAFEHNLKNIFS